MFFLSSDSTGATAMSLRTLSASSERSSMADSRSDKTAPPLSSATSQVLEFPNGSVAATSFSIPSQTTPTVVTPTNLKEEPNKDSTVLVSSPQSSGLGASALGVDEISELSGRDQLGPLHSNSMTSTMLNFSAAGSYDPSQAGGIWF